LRVSADPPRFSYFLVHPPPTLIATPVVCSKKANIALCHSQLSCSPSSWCCVASVHLAANGDVTQSRGQMR
jgi:hypothetical protein